MPDKDQKTWYYYDEGRELLRAAGVPESEWTPHAVEVASFFADRIARDMAQKAARRLVEECGLNT